MDFLSAVTLCYTAELELKLGLNWLSPMQLKEIQLRQIVRAKFEIVNKISREFNAHSFYEYYLIFYGQIMLKYRFVV